MAEHAPIFPAAEHRARVARLQAGMEATGLSALLLTEAADVFWVTGFLTRFWESPTRPWFVVVPAAGEPVAVIPAIGAALMAKTWVRDIRSWNAPAPEDDGVSLLAEALAEAVPPTGAVGLPMDLGTHLRMPLADYEALRARLSPRRFVDAGALVRDARAIKSEAEVARIRAACAVADRAFARVPGFALPGRPLDRVFRDFQAALLAEGADWVSYLAGGAGPDGYDDVISPAGPRPLAAGDVLMLDTGAVTAGHFCDFDRNWAIGPASDAARRVHAALFAATEDALAQLRPGMTAADAHRILWEGVARAGGTPLSGRLGHGLGIQLTEPPSFAPNDPTVLREGMVLTLEPGAEVRPGRIMVHEENVVLRAGGPELLSARAPAELPEIGG